MSISAVLMLMVGCPNNAGGENPDAGENPDVGDNPYVGETGGFKDSTYEVKTTDGLRYYRFLNGFLTITEKTTTEDNLFIPYKGPFTVKGNVVSYTAIDQKPTTESFNFKDDGTFTVTMTVSAVPVEPSGKMLSRTTTNSRTGTTFDSNTNAGESVTLPPIPDGMLTMDDLIGYFVGDIRYSETHTEKSYIQFTETMMIEHKIYEDGGVFKSAYKDVVPYIAQFGKNDDTTFDGGTVRIRNSVSKTDFKTANSSEANYFDYSVTYDTNNKIAKVDVGGDTIVNYHKQENGFSIESNDTTQLPASDLYGTWTGTRYSTSRETMHDYSYGFSPEHSTQLWRSHTAGSKGEESYDQFDAKEMTYGGVVKATLSRLDDGRIEVKDDLGQILHPVFLPDNKLYLNGTVLTKRSLLDDLTKTWVSTHTWDSTVAENSTNYSISKKRMVTIDTTGSLKETETVVESDYTGSKEEWKEGYTEIIRNISATYTLKDGIVELTSDESSDKTTIWVLDEDTIVFDGNGMQFYDSEEWYDNSLLN